MERQIAVSAREVTTRRGVRSTAYGSLGIASSGPVGTPVVIDVGGEPVLEVGVNNDRTCVRLGNGRIKCWGSALRPTPSALRPPLYALRPTPYALRPTPFALRPTPFALRPARTPHTEVRRAEARCTAQSPAHAVKRLWGAALAPTCHGPSGRHPLKPTCSRLVQLAAGRESIKGARLRRRYAPLTPLPPDGVGMAPFAERAGKESLPCWSFKRSRSV